MNKLRRRIAGQLDHGPRGLAIVSGAGDRRVIENEAIEPDLIGRIIVAECFVVGLDRLKVEWTGDAHN